MADTPKKNKETLKGYFKAGAIPREEHFAELIESNLNLEEEGVSEVKGSLEVNGSIKSQGFTHDLLWKKPLEKLASVDGDEALKERDGFGDPVAIHGDRLIVGAKGGSWIDGGGKAYIYQYGDGNWLLQATLKAPSDQWAKKQEIDNFFGNSVSIFGDQAIVGAPQPVKKKNGEYQIGEAYVFEQSAGEWKLVATFAPDDLKLLSRFGASVCIHENTAIVGALGYGMENPGGAYIYQRINSVWTFITKLNPEEELTDYHNYISRVAINYNTAIVATRAALNKEGNFVSRGRVYMFERLDDKWSFVSELGQLIDDEILKHIKAFGSSIAIHQNTVIIGGGQLLDQNNKISKGQVFVFEKISKQWSLTDSLVPGMDYQDSKTGDNFGNSVAIFGDWVIVGGMKKNPNGSEAGCVYLFIRRNGKWSRVTMISSSTEQEDDGFGKSVAINDNFAVVGARSSHFNGKKYAGQAYLFTSSIEAHLSAQSATILTLEQRIEKLEALLEKSIQKEENTNVDIYIEEFKDKKRLIDALYGKGFIDIGKRDEFLENRISLPFLVKENVKKEEALEIEEFLKEQLAAVRVVKTGTPVDVEEDNANVDIYIEDYRDKRMLIDVLFKSGIIDEEKAKEFDKNRIPLPLLIKENVKREEVSGSFFEKYGAKILFVKTGTPIDVNEEKSSILILNGRQRDVQVALKLLLEVGILKKDQAEEFFNVEPPLKINGSFSKEDAEKIHNVLRKERIKVKFDLRK